METNKIIAFCIWIFSLMLASSGLYGVLTPNYPYLEGARNNLFINFPLTVLLGFLIWKFDD
jgi:hypothetical protein